MNPVLERPVRIGEKWSDIRAPDCPLVIETRPLPFGKTVLSSLLACSVFELRIEGSPPALPAQMAGLPLPLIRDATGLAARFARFMKVDTVRLRLERIDRNACRKIHSDYTDVRLICTYAGPGTDYVADSGNEAIERMEAGWVGLFKGRSYSAGHAPALHRSPPVEGTGEKRLLLVIDTPLSPAMRALAG